MNTSSKSGFFSYLAGLMVSLVFRMEIRKCEFCNFKTESKLAMAYHLETPHMKNFVYKCNFCSYEVRSPHDILFHMEAEHAVRGNFRLFLVVFFLWNKFLQVIWNAHRLSINVPRVPSRTIKRANCRDIWWCARANLNRTGTWSRHPIGSRPRKFPECPKCAPPAWMPRSKRTKRWRPIKTPNNSTSSYLRWVFLIWVSQIIPVVFKVQIFGKKGE